MFLDTLPTLQGTEPDTNPLHVALPTVLSDGTLEEAREGKIRKYSLLREVLAAKGYLCSGKSGQLGPTKRRAPNPLHVALPTAGLYPQPHHITLFNIMLEGPQRQSSEEGGGGTSWLRGRSMPLLMLMT